MRVSAPVRRAAAWAITALVVAGAAVLVFPAAEARADAYTYSTTRRILKAGILMLDSTIDANGDGVISPGEAALGPENTAPYLFHIADARADVKPTNWEFVNPLAPQTVTADVKARWDARDPGSPYGLGQNVTKNMAAYWEVFLSRTSVEDLVQFDLLFIANHRDVKFTPAEREKLRKVVDAGGIVWIEDSAGMRIRGDGRFFLDQLQFRSEGSTANAGPVINAPNHPILNTPYPLTFQEIARLGDKNYSNYYLSGFAPGETGPINRGTSGRGLAPPNPEVLLNIVGNRATATAARPEGLPYIAAGNYGSGAVIATAGDSGDDVNNIGGSVRGNRGAFSGPNIQVARTEDLKFVYNLVAWGSANNTERRNPRRTASSFEAVGAPLLTRFDFTTPGTPADSIVASQSSALIVKNTIFVSGVVGGTATLRAYDAQPFRDSDRDGNPDDGLPDLGLGAPYDEIWRADLPGGGTGQPSSPTFATLYNAGTGRVVEAVFVTLADGRLAAFEAFPNNSGRLAQTSPLVYNNGTAGGSYTGPGALAAPAPAFYEGRVYVVQPNGLVRCVDAVSGTTLWTSFDPASPPPATLNPTGPPTVGFTRLQSASGVGSYSGGNTLDLMLYQPALETNGGNPPAGRILPYWLGTRNEVMVSPTSQQAGFWEYSTRVALSGNRYYIANAAPFAAPTARVFVNDTAAGNSARENFEMGNQAAGYAVEFQQEPSGALNGRVRISPPPPQGSLVAVDYDVLYVTPAYGRPSGLNGDGSRNPSLRTNGDSLVRGLDALALSPDDLLIYSAQESASGGNALTSVYSLNEQFGTGTSRARWRFTIHGGYGIDPANPDLFITTPSGTPPKTPDPTVNGTSLEDLPVLQNSLVFPANWPENNTAQLLSDKEAEALLNVEPVGAPVVTNEGVSYVLARATGALSNRAYTVLMAFQANAEVVLNVGPMDQSRPPVVAQLNALTYNPASGTGDTVTLQQNQFSVDYARGKITITNFQGAAGAGSPLSASQSFVVTTTLAGQTAQSVQVHRPINSEFGDDFTPLLWYYVLPGQPLSAPTLIGDFVYFTQATAAGAQVVALDADPKSNDPLVKKARQVTGVVATLNPGQPNESRPSPNHVRWTKPLVGLGGAAVQAGAAPVGAQNALVVNTSAGPFVFEDTLTLVADGKRVLETRADGSAAWALDSTVKYTVAGGELPVFNPAAGGGIENPPGSGRYVEERKSIARPSVVRRLSASDLLIADTGNNRVLRADRAGRVIWDLEQINDPYGILASGDPVTLNEPTDVQFWLTPTFSAAGTPNGYEAHYLIADAGNFRVIEVVDFFDAAGNLRGDIRDLDGNIIRPERVLVWTTRTSSKEGRRLRFQSVERFVGTGKYPGTGQDVYGQPFIVAVVGNLRAAGADATAATDFTGGALVNLVYKPFNTSFAYTDLATRDPLPAVAPEWQPPAAGSAAATTEPADNGLIAAAIDDLVLTSAGGAARIKRVTRPLYFQQLTLPDATSPTREKRVYLLCDADGVYAIEPRADPATGRSIRYVTWHFTQEDYDRINGVDAAGNVLPTTPGYTPRFAFPTPTVNRNVLPRFVPSSVRRLPSGNYLITNSFTGRSPLFDTPLAPGLPPAGPGQFLGEVLEIKPDFSLPADQTNKGGTFAGFSVPQIVKEAFPSGAVRNRQQMGADRNTGLLEQPLFADRLF